MLKKEWQAILKNKFFIVIIIALMTIPALYNLIFLSSMWDPYGKISDLPVAVVNQDQSAEINGKSVNLGKDLADEMAKGNDLDYHFVSDNTAQKGLKDETYFMEIKIPSDFSKNAGSLVSDKPTSSTIHYQTSKGHNFIASKMSDSAMEKLKEKVSKNITETYTKTIFENLTTLASGVTKAADGSNQLVDGSQTLKSGSSDISSNLDKLATSSLTFKDGADTLNVGLGQYMAGVSTLKDGSASLSQAVTQYTDGAAQLANGTNQLATGTASLAAGVAKLSESNADVAKLVAGSAALSEGLQKMSDGISIPDLTVLKTNLLELQSGINEYNNSVQNSPISGMIANDVKTIEQALADMQAEQVTNLKTLRATNAYKSHPEEQATLEGLVSPSPTLVKNITATVTDLQNKFEMMETQITQGSGKINAGSEKLLPIASGTFDKLTGGLTGIKSNIDNGLKPGANLVNVGLTKLVDGVNSASDGANKLNQSTAQINTGAQTLIGNNTQLNAGSSKLVTGAAQLTQNSPKLLDGSAQLASGAAQISDGSGKLASGSNTLTSGIGTLTAGATTLNTGLTDAKTKLAENATAELNAKKIASPLNITHQDKDNSPENGVGMAPYMISVALFVGAVATNMIISGTLSGESPKSRRDYLLARIGVNGLIGLGEGVLVYLAVHLLGLSANHELAMFGFTVLVAVCFMFIVTFFNTWLGKPGAFLMLILLLLQLGASAGTYPLALTSNFFQKLNPWMPMTYAVKGFRQVISLTGQIGQETGILLAITVVCFILLSFVGYRKAKA
ncbi:YhgE/Pip domain-containing protein [Lactococcus carnosus]|uniref:YhgE/Pip domain-containing protein n=1 Tax=Pseudolactococcus carnosus TaxID=2749961 RepID=UPI001FBAAF57|nr:YhgE/Pip domain-containing protein [Lactococcus carnosus]MCJ1971608.1 YhgE/Pip domain-containing protein [Lactococcus carnosus]MCJ1981819.1 YhgE/Pip domain-containing protein [Lactococcus carnosus]